jgi:CrcB protein
MFDIFIICIGACMGALLRWQLGLMLNNMVEIPLGTLAVNWIGGYLIGMFIGLLQLVPNLDPMWRLLVVTGFLGTLTTFSTFSSEIVGFIMNERYFTAMGAVGLHLFGSLGLTVLGIKTIQWGLGPA